MEHQALGCSDKREVGLDNQWNTRPGCSDKRHEVIHEIPGLMVKKGI